jgi:hypothetical protein
MTFLGEDYFRDSFIFISWVKVWYVGAFTVNAVSIMRTPCLAQCMRLPWWDSMKSSLRSIFGALSCPWMKSGEFGLIPFFGNLSIGDSLLNVAISLLIMGVKKQFTIQFYFYDIFLLTERFFNSYYFFSSFSKHFMESYKLVKLQTLSVNYK